MKKAFTLIELLAVIIVLAIIALIATPIVLDVINDARDSADNSSANMVLTAANNYFAESLLDKSKKEKLDGITNLFDELSVQNKPEEGQVYINEEGKVSMLVKINNKCYVKKYTDSSINEVENNIYDCSIPSLDVWDGTVEAITPVGDTYYVFKGSHLAWISQEVANGNETFEGKTIVLKNNIDMGAEFDEEGNLLNDSKYKFTPIGNDGKIFYGNFDGENNYITNLYVNETTNFVGLFGKYYGTSFENLIVKDSYIKSTGGPVGIIGGNSTGSSELLVSNIQSINNVIMGDANIGGIIGQFVSGNIKNCINSSKVVATDDSAAGIVGRFASGNFIGNTNYGNIISNNIRAAGLVGYADSGNISNNLNCGNVTSNSNYTGGIVAYTSVKKNTVIENNTNRGNVTSNSKGGAGIVSYLGLGIVNNNSNYGIIQGKEGYAGGIVGEVNNGSLTNNINRGSINSDSHAVGGITGAIETTASVINNINYGTVQGEEKWIGGIVGINSSADFSTISNNINEGKITTSHGAFRVAGIVGNSNENILLYNNINKGEIDAIGDGTATSYGAGGIVGTIGNDGTDNPFYIVNCYNEGKVKGNLSAGGVVGNFYKTNSGDFIKNVYNTGTIESPNGYAGGIVGKMDADLTLTSSIENIVNGSYNSGIVKGKYAAGLVGANVGISNSINYIKPTGTNNYGVIAHTNGDEKIENVYYINTASSNYGTAKSETELNNDFVKTILGTTSWNYSGNYPRLYKVNASVTDGELSINYLTDILR